MDIDIRAYAKLGAQARLDALTAEINSIRRAFPGLGRSAPVKARAEADAGGKQPAPPARRGRMSAAARKAVGERMRKYWAAKRKASAASGAEPAEKAAATTEETAARPRRSASRKKTGGTRKRGRRARKGGAKKR